MRGRNIGTASTGSTIRYRESVKKTATKRTAGCAVKPPISWTGLRSIAEGLMSSEKERDSFGGEMIEVPAPTAWPMITALGIVLLAAGLVTHLGVSALGLILTLRGAVGWFRENLPVQRVEHVPVRPAIERAQPVKVSARSVVHLTAGQASHRVRIPVEIHPYSSGLKGGIVGGAAM